MGFGRWTAIPPRADCLPITSQRPSPTAHRLLGYLNRIAVDATNSLPTTYARSSCICGPSTMPAPIVPLVSPDLGRRLYCALYVATTSWTMLDGSAELEKPVNFTRWSGFVKTPARTNIGFFP